MDELNDIFSEIDFSLINHTTGKCHVWDEEGNCRQIDASEARRTGDEMLPIGIQWWRGNEDIFVTLMKEYSVGGLLFHVRLVDFNRKEEAEIGRLIIQNIVPEKREFPDDFPVFQLSSQ